MPQEPQFFTRTSDIWDAMYTDAAAAKISIELDQYIIEDDEVGRKFMALLTQKAREGVSVHLLLDYIGSYKAYVSDAMKELIAAGARVRFYNRLPKYRLLQPAKWFPRNHVKVLLIDSDIAYVGSACMRDDMKDWRDSTVRLTDGDAEPVERRMAYSRLVWWRRPMGSRKRAYADYDGQFAFAIRSPGVGINPIYRDMIYAIRDAKKTISIATPYFLAPYALRRALRAAARRGVKVRIITNARSDVRIADLVSASYFKRMLKKKIEIFMYQPFMLHAKVVIVDGNWASLGSSNIDYLSLHLNREANLTINDPACVARLQEQFENDLKNCQMVHEDFWQNLPWWERMAGYIGRSIKAIL